MNHERRFSLNFTLVVFEGLAVLRNDQGRLPMDATVPECAPFQNR